MAEGHKNYQMTPAKKQKTEEKDIFVQFINKQTECKRLLKVVNDLVSGSGTNPVIACPMRITQADADLTQSFSSAICMAEFYMKIDDHSRPFTINVGSLFDKGCAILLEFLQNKKVPEHEESRRALLRLIEYLSANGKFLANLCAHSELLAFPCSSCFMCY